jgi:hypothetical protein
MSSTNRGSNRDGTDFYRTPMHAVEALVKAIKIPDPTLDPCAGDGALIRAVKDLPGRMGGRFRGMEIDEHLVAAARADDLVVNHCDGLAASWRHENVLMNPPYKEALEWVRRGVDARSCTALVRLGFLASKKRREFWLENPPTAIVILTRRPSFRSDGQTDSADYCWVHWSQIRNGQTALLWS